MGRYSKARRYGDLIKITIKHMINAEVRGLGKEKPASI
jgi:hypothetical protein